MTLGVIPRFPVNPRRRGAASTLRDFPKGCGRPKIYSNPNPNHVSDVDLESKCKEVESVSVLKNNDESEKLSCKNGKINKSVVEEVLTSKLVNGNSEELCTMGEGRDGYLNEKSFDSKKNTDENVVVFSDYMEITDKSVAEGPDSKMITDQNVKGEVFDSMKITDQHVEEGCFGSKIIIDGNVEEECFDSKIITNQNVEELLDSKVITDVKIVKEREDKAKDMSRDVKVDLLKKKSSGAKPVAKKYIGKVVARKSAGNEATNIKRKVTDEKLDDSLDDYTDKLFVQALMSSDDCPWRNDKKPSGIISNSATPKPKRKRASNFQTFFSAPQHRNNVKSSVDGDVGRQHDDNDKALTVYDGPHDLCITMTPTVSSMLFVGGNSSNKNGAASRSMVQRALRIYQILARKFLQEDEKLSGNSKNKVGAKRYDLDAAKIMKVNNQFVNHGETIIGSVPGVEVGDEFRFRTELSVVGLHRPYQAGIDYANIKGRLLALSVVASGGYPDDVDGSDVLIYTGSGGNPSLSKNAKAGDQKLERGNLALKNCIDVQSPVRVIYGVKESTKADALDSRPKLVSTFTYDGLYLVERYWTEVRKNEFSVYKFQLRRIPGQPEIALKEIMKVKNSKERVGVIANDISCGKESVRICAINTIDNERPMPFNYLNKMIYRSSYVPKPSVGCDCTNSCVDSKKCACAVKNDGLIPYNFNGALVEAKVLVYECGPNCKCPPWCYNRVSQFGIKIPLEIFKTETTGWGVRSLASIPSGTFVCEYVGEMIDFEEAERRDNDEYLFDIGNNYDDRSLFDGLPSYIPGAHASDVHESMENGGFTIDAAKFGNVGRFINHSCTPNLFAQSVLYDNDEKNMPHIMFFAADNIPPLKELTYHYNYTLDQVRDENGNIKKKNCFCGSPECTGRLY